MNEFLSFVKKECRHILRDKRTMLIVLVMPVVQMILFGYAVSTEVNNARVDIVGDTGDAAVRKIVERIDSNPSLNVLEVLPSADEVFERFEKGESDVAVCFDMDFGRNLEKNGAASVMVAGDGSDPNTAQMIVNYVLGVLRAEQHDLALASGADMQVMQPSVQLMYNPAMKSSYNFVPGVMGLILTIICSMMTSISIVREKESGTMEMLLVSPVRPLWIVVSKLIPYLVISAVNFLTILLLSRYVMDVPVRGSIVLLILVSLVFVISSLALGLLISVVASTQKSALLLSGMGLMMPTMLLSGIIFPCENMPWPLEWLSHLMPAKWFIIMVKKIMIQGVGFEFMVKEFVILSVMTAFLMTVSIRKFKIRL